MHPPSPPSPPSPAAPRAVAPAPRIALAHDWLVGYRGGEAVLDHFARLAAEIGADNHLFTMVDDGRPIADAVDSLPRTTSFLQSIGGAGAPRRWLLPLYPLAVAQLSRRLAREHARAPFDLLISSSSAAIKGLRPPRGVPHLCYCHSPARYLWSQSSQYARGERGLLRRLGLAIFARPLRRWDRRTAKGVTTFLANSSHIAAEIKRCYKRDSVVLHPPVRTEFFAPDSVSPRRDFWLVAGALEPYKRTDLAIAAAGWLGVQLIIAGDGSQHEHLRRIAGPTVRFEGRVTDRRLRELFRTARLLVFPQIEDFGIIAVEAQAAGCPVLAFRAGGSLDTVIEGQTGAFFDEPTADSIIAAAARVPPHSAATTHACRKSAQRFGEAAFDDAARQHILDALDKRRPHPSAHPAPPRPEPVPKP